MMKNSTLHTFSLSILLAGCTIAPDPGGVAGNYDPNRPEPRTLGYHEIKKNKSTDNNNPNGPEKGIGSSGQGIQATQNNQVTPIQGLCGTLKTEFNFEPILGSLDWGRLAGVLKKGTDQHSCLPEHKKTLENIPQFDIDEEDALESVFPLEEGSPYNTSSDYIKAQNQPIFCNIRWCLKEQDKTNPKKWSIQVKLQDNQQKKIASAEPEVEPDSNKSFIEFDDSGKVISFSTSYVRKNVSYKDFPEKVANLKFTNGDESDYIITRDRGGNPVALEKQVDINIDTKKVSSLFIRAYDRSSLRSPMNCFDAYGGRMGGVLKEWSVDLTPSTQTPAEPSTVKSEVSLPAKKDEVIVANTTNEPKTTSTSSLPPAPINIEKKTIEGQPESKPDPVQNGSIVVKPSEPLEEDFNLPKGTLENLNFDENYELPKPKYALNLSAQEKAKIVNYIADNEKKEIENKEALNEHGYRFDVSTNTTVTKSEILNKCSSSTAVIKPTVFKVFLKAPEEFIDDADEESTATMIGKINRRLRETKKRIAFGPIKNNLKSLKKKAKINYFELAGCYDKNPEKTYLFFHNNIDQMNPSDDKAQWYPFSKAHSKLVPIGKREIAFRALFTYVMPNSELVPIIGEDFAGFINNPAKWPRMNITWGGRLKLDKSGTQLSDLPTASIRSSKRINVSVHLTPQIKTDWYPDTGQEIQVKNNERNEYIIIPNKNVISGVGPLDVALKVEFTHGS